VTGSGSKVSSEEGREFGRGAIRKRFTRIGRQDEEFERRDSEKASDERVQRKNWECMSRCDRVRRQSKFRRGREFGRGAIRKRFTRAGRQDKEFEEESQRKNQREKSSEEGQEKRNTEEEEVRGRSSGQLWA
jgi:hypothetical protein